MPKPDLAHFYPLAVCVLTVSDSRTQQNDSSGALLCDALQTAGHKLVGRSLLPNNKYLLRAQLSEWIASEQVQVVLINGGTGYAKNNCTIDAITPLLDSAVPGFGELFRQLSYQDIGSAALQSGAFAGFANDTLIFAMPGSGSACHLAMQQLILPQLSGTTGPCNFVAHVKHNPGQTCGA